jgi:hypothetical protein
VKAERHGAEREVPTQAAVEFSLMLKSNRGRVPP